jgi:hypothetical protein
MDVGHSKTLTLGALLGFADVMLVLSACMTVQTPFQQKSSGRGVATTAAPAAVRACQVFTVMTLFIAVPSKYFISVGVVTSFHTGVMEPPLVSPLRLVNVLHRLCLV